MSKSVKLKDGSYIDSEGISTKVYSTTGTYVTATWTHPSSYPKLTLGKKGIYLVEITWNTTSDSFHFPTYYQLQINGATLYGGRVKIYNSNNNSGPEINALSTTGIVKTTVDNDTVHGYMHTETAGLSFTEYITAVYLGAVEI